MKKRIIKATRFMKEKGWVEVKEKETIWFNNIMLVLHTPESFAIGTDEYGLDVYLKPGRYEYDPDKKEFVASEKIPDYQDIIDKIKRQPDDYTKAEIVTEHRMLKLLEPENHRMDTLIELKNEDKKAHIRYDAYKYLTENFWKADKWEISTPQEATLAYCDNVLMAIVMPVDLSNT